MTDREYNETRRRIKRLCDQWIRSLGFGWFKIVVDYWREGFGDGESRTVARTFVKWEYREAKIEWNMPLVKHMLDLDEDLEDTLFHELGHVAVAEMRDYSDTKTGRKHEEHVASQFAVVVRSAHNIGLRDGKKSASKRQAKKGRKR